MRKTFRAAGRTVAVCITATLVVLYSGWETCKEIVLHEIKFRKKQNSHCCL